MIRSCDTMVALGAATRSGQTLFAKNSDRQARECQPLVRHERLSHASGARTRCQFVELPEAPVTYRHVGSRPYWCWGYEHGFNEFQVVIGNEGLGSKLESEDPRLIGMELIRLGLERGRSAAEALEVMQDAITRDGQGIFKAAPAAGNYDNGFLVADPNEAYVLQAAGHHWAEKRVERTIGISNVYSIETDWDRLSPEAESYAVGQGWWAPEGGRFDFASAYSKQADRTEGGGARRRARSCAVLAQRDGSVDAATMMRLLSDHSDSPAPDEPFRTDVAHRGGICMHSEDDGTGTNTAASLVADLCADGSRLPVYWCSFYSPCQGLFLPVFVEGALPPILSRGDADPSDDSLWWLFHRLSRAARVDPTTRIPAIRQQWTSLQDQLFETAYPLACEARRLLDSGQADTASQLLTDYMNASVSTLLDRLKGMLNAFGGYPTSQEG